MFEVRRYTPDRADEWNEFVARAKNGTFLFDRQYMDYHADRFADHSLMFYRDGVLCALLPANESDTTLYSHQGLTYGGLVMDYKLTAADTLQLFADLNSHLHRIGISRVVYKAIPWIYHQLPSEEDLYALTQVCGARLSVRELSTTIMLQRNIRWSRIRRRGVKRAEDAGFVVEVSKDFDAFWPVLEANLLTNHQVHPVHTVDEMKLLHSRFPKHIVLYTATLNGEVVGGVVMYLTPQVAHAHILTSENQQRMPVTFSMSNWSSRKRALAGVRYVMTPMNGTYEVLGTETDQCSLRRGDASCYQRCPG